MSALLDTFLVVAAVSVAVGYCGWRVVRRARGSKTGCVGSGCGCPAKKSVDTHRVRLCSGEYT